MICSTPHGLIYSYIMPRGASNIQHDRLQAWLGLHGWNSGARPEERGGSGLLLQITRGPRVKTERIVYDSMTYMHSYIILTSCRFVSIHYSTLRIRCLAVEDIISRIAQAAQTLYSRGLQGLQHIRIHWIGFERL